MNKADTEKLVRGFWAVRRYLGEECAAPRLEKVVRGAHIFHLPML